MVFSVYFKYIHIKDAQGLLHFMIYNLCTLLSGTLGILYPVEL